MTPDERDRLLEDDRRFVWHPFTQMKDWMDEEPLVVERAEGVELIDVDGNRYLDGVSSLWTNVHGHGVPEIDDAVRAQLDRVAHTTLLGLSNVPSIELARELVTLSPSSLTRVFYSDSGSTAVEVALKMAFQYHRQRGDTGRTRFACLSDAYHGDTIGSVSVGGIDLFHSMYRPLLFETVRIPSPFCYRCPLGLDRASCVMECADEAERIISENREQLAALVMEPLVQGAAGMVVHPEGFLRRIAAACRASDVLLILDEVATGFGRTGRMFACDREGIGPDFLALAKGITGGYLPLAATLVSEEVFDGFLGSFESHRTFFHGHTYTGNPLACAAALGSIEAFRRHRTLAHVAEMIPVMDSGMQAFRGLDHVGDVRNLGMMAGIELVRDPATREPFDGGLRMGHRVVMEARRRGAILRPLGDVVILMPPLAMDGEQLGRLLDITRESITAATEDL